MTENTTKNKSKVTTTSPQKHKEKTSIYINKEEDRIISSQKAEDGFFKRILNYSFKKKKNDEEKDKSKSASTDTLEEPRPNTVSVTISPVTIKLTSNEEDANVKKLQKTGPASRQRVFPKEIAESMNKYASNIEMHRSSVTSSNDIRVSMHKSEEYLVKMRKLSENEDSRKSSEISQHKVPKIYGLSPYQQKVSRIVVDIDEKDSPTMRKPVEKSKSFRVYSDNLSNNLHTANNLPSLPNLSGPLSIGSLSNNFLETEHKFFSMTENMNIGKTKVYKDYISNLEDNNTNSQDSLEECKSMTSLQKFEINDYNLMNPRESPVDQQPKSIVMTTNAIQEQQTSTVILNKSSQNISQIEENIDKLVSSPFVSIIKTPEHEGGKVPEFLKIHLNKVESPKIKSSVTMTVTPPTPVSPSPQSPATNSNDKENNAIKCRRFSNENVEITESKPPLPPSANRHSSFIEATVPKSPTALKNKRSSINISQEIADDRKVILQRRTSVTEEKIKYERRISSSSEDIKIERKKSNSEELLEKRGSNYSTNSGSSSGDELVVLRKKSFTENNRANSLNNDKDQPELMKVFARRSLKIKSDDTGVVSDDSSEKYKQQNVDSDKENHSSEEKLDKIPKIEVKISSISKEDRNEHQPKIIAAKPFGTPVNRFGNNRNTFVETRKTFNSISPQPPSLTSSNNNSINNNSNSNNNNFVIKSSVTTGGTSEADIENNNNNNISSKNSVATLNQINNNVTSSNSTNNNSNTETITDIGEFKGILQRRAEWEKRAKEGFK